MNKNEKLDAIVLANENAGGVKGVLKAIKDDIIISNPTEKFVKVVQISIMQFNNVKHEWPKVQLRTYKKIIKFFWSAIDVDANYREIRKDTDHIRLRQLTYEILQMAKKEANEVAVNVMEPEL